MSSRTASRRKRTSIWGTKPQHGANAGDDAVQNQPLEPVGTADGGQKLPTALGTQSPKEHVVGPVGAHGADGDGPAAHGNGIHQVHDHGKEGAAPAPWLVTMRSILSEVVIPVRFFFTLDLTTLEMYS